MADISEIMDKYGLNIEEDKKEEFLKDFRSSYKSSAELDRVKEKKELIQSQLNDLNSVVDNYKKVDIDGLKNEISDWKTKYENAEKEYTTKINKHLLSDELNKFKFSSKTAKDGVFSKAFSNESIKFEDGKIIGLNEFLESIKNDDPDVFVKENNKEDIPQFTREISTKNSKSHGNPNEMSFRDYKKWRNQK